MIVVASSVATTPVLHRPVLAGSPGNITGDEEQSGYIYTERAATHWTDLALFMAIHKVLRKQHTA